MPLKMLKWNVVLIPFINSICRTYMETIYAGDTGHHFHTTAVQRWVMRRPHTRHQLWPKSIPVCHHSSKWFTQSNHTSFLHTLNNLSALTTQTFHPLTHTHAHTPTGGQGTKSHWWLFQWAPHQPLLLSTGVKEKQKSYIIKNGKCNGHLFWTVWQAGVPPRHPIWKLMGLSIVPFPGMDKLLWGWEWVLLSDVLGWKEKQEVTSPPKRVW